jgi:endonuclease/exonuclease/phosphatase (EEP) superfamily protein YafD
VKRFPVFATWTATVGIAVATVSAQLDRLRLGEVGWLFDLFAQFPGHLAVFALATLVLALILRLPRPAVIAGSAAAISTLSFLSVTGFATPQTVHDGSTLVRIISANVHGFPDALARVADLAKNYDADLVSIYEAPAMTDEEAAALFPMATVRLIRHSPDGRELSKKMMVIAKDEVSEIEISPTGGRSNRAVLRYRINAGKGSIQVVAAHPVSPDSPAGMHDRDRMLVSLGEGLDEVSPFLVMGDFNATPWASVFARTPGSRAGDPRWESTFPAGQPFIGIPIDHITFGGGLALVDHRVGPEIGSDHLPVLATFALPDLAD